MIGDRLPQIGVSFRIDDIESTPHHADRSPRRDCALDLGLAKQNAQRAAMSRRVDPEGEARHHAHADGSERCTKFERTALSI